MAGSPARFAFLALGLLACKKLPPERALPPNATIPVAPEDADTVARFESEFSLARMGLEFGYRPIDLNDPSATCCGYDTAQVIRIEGSSGRAQAIMPFTYGQWVLLYWSGDRLWAFNETDIPEGGAGDLEIVYSPDRGRSWYLLSELPSPSNDTASQRAPIVGVAFDGSGHGSLTLHLEEDDGEPHSAPSIIDRLRAWASTSPVTHLPLGDRVLEWISGPPVDERVQARAGYYSYETDDFGRTWSEPEYSRTPRPPGGVLGVQVEYFGSQGTTRVVCPELNVDGRVGGQVEIAEAISEAMAGDKLGGWPHWTQDIAYPNCPRCRQEMQTIFQIDSQDHLPYHFGDAGCGHVFQCPAHLEVVTFSYEGH